jgi:hypothetical protein
VTDFRTAVAQVDDQQINANPEISDTQLGCLFRPTARSRRAIKVADLSSVHSLLWRPEFCASRGTNFNAHGFSRRTGIDCDDVDLVFTDPSIACQHSPA